MFLTGLFALLIGIGIVPVIGLSVLGVDPWLTLGCWMLLCLLLAALDFALAATSREITVTRRGPERALRDEHVQTEVLLHNTGSRRLRGTLRDGWQPTAGAGTARAEVDVPAGERRAHVIALRPRRRGELRSGFVALRARGPLSLAGRQARFDVPGVIRVLPPFTSRRHLPSRLARLRELDGNTAVLVRGQGTEFDSLREYVRGDDVRSIDWRATARAGTTMLRTWRPERDRHVVIIIDTGRTSATRVGDGVRLDAAMEATLLLAALASRAGDHVHLIMFDRALRARVTRAEGPALLPAFVNAMAPIEPTLIDTDWEGAFAQVRALGVRPSLVVALTAQDSVAAARGFLGSLALLPRGAQLLVGTATDLPSERVEQRTAEDVFRDAASARAAREAAEVSAAVRRAGGDAVSADADGLPPLVADRYLALKAAGKL